MEENGGLHGDAEVVLGGALHGFGRKLRPPFAISLMSYPQPIFSSSFFSSRRTSHFGTNRGRDDRIIGISPPQGPRSPRLLFSRQTAHSVACHCFHLPFLPPERQSLAMSTGACAELALHGKGEEEGTRARRIEAPPTHGEGFLTRGRGERGRIRALAAGAFIRRGHSEKHARWFLSAGNRPRKDSPGALLSLGGKWGTTRI